MTYTIQFGETIQIGPQVIRLARDVPYTFLPTEKKDTLD